MNLTGNSACKSKILHVTVIEGFKLVLLQFKLDIDLDVSLDTDWFQMLIHWALHMLRLYILNGKNILACIKTYT